ncbi:DUF4157 domain-containing protein [Streptomyces sp. NPDC050504]|uniref:eCIS core domain-containing protein n=1 Tax=Streptomyces sp. NPDC050504 TaxID=3365618 RepID=UPI00378A329A
MRTDQTARGEDRGGRGERTDPGAARSPGNTGAGAGAAARAVAARGARGLTPGAAAALQRAAGNAALGAAVGRPTGGADGVVQRAGEEERHQHGAGCGHGESVQRSAVPDVLRSAGKPLDDSTRSDMESRLGADFSDVRIHDNAAAKASAAEVGARAYTSGSHVVIGDGGADKHTLAHELTHVIQQRQGPVAGTDNGSGLKVSDPTDRFEREAEANATRAMNGPAPVQRAEDENSAPVPGDPAAVQRAVGFEFEAQWNVRKVEDAGGADAEVLAGRQAARETDIDREMLLSIRVNPYSSYRKDVTAEQLAGADGWVDAGGSPTAAGLAVLEHLGLGRSPDGAENAKRKGFVYNLMVDSKVSEAPLLGENLGKGLVEGMVAQGSGYALTADASPSGGSNLEWITDPISDRKTLSKVMNDLTAMTAFLDGNASKPFIKSEDITRGNAVPRPDLRIYPDGKPLAFAPQTTAGLRLDRLPELVEYLVPPETWPLKDTLPDKYNPMKPKRREKAHRDLYNVANLGNLASATGAASRVVEASAVPEEGRGALTGLVGLLVSYLLESQTLQQGANAKSIAGGLMARNDFAQGFRSLPASVRDHFAADPAGFAELVHSAAASAGLLGGPGDPVFGRTVERGLAGARTETSVSLTRRAWLEGIPAGKDLLKNLTKLSEDERADPAVEGHEEEWEGIHKSLGALSAEETATDRASGETIALMVAEFRRMNAVDVHTKDLKPLAMSAFGLLERLNTGRKLKY